MATPVTAMTTASTSPPLLRHSPNWSERSRRLYSISVAIRTMWNLAFVAVSAVTLKSTVNEKPETSLRVWILVYSFGCLLRVLRVQMLWLIYKKRNDTGVSRSSGIAISSLIRSARILEKVNSELSNILVGTGYIWLCFAGNDAPRLFRVTLAFHVYNDFCAGIGLLSLIRSLYFTKLSNTQKGASDAVIRNLPKYIFEEGDNEDQGRACRMVPMQTNAQDFFVEHVLLKMDACCCICLCNYDHGTELCSLPCNHHFHAACIHKWLLLRATCPLCRGHIIVRN